MVSRARLFRRTVVTMVESQKEKAPDDGWRRIDEQLQTYIGESRRRMEMLEKSQARLNAEDMQR